MFFDIHEANMAFANRTRVHSPFGVVIFVTRKPVVVVERVGADDIAVCTELVVLPISL